MIHTRYYVTLHNSGHVTRLTFLHIFMISSNKLRSDGVGCGPNVEEPINVHKIQVCSTLNNICMLSKWYCRHMYSIVVASYLRSFCDKSRDCGGITEQLL